MCFWAVPLLMRLVAGVSSRRTGFAPGVSQCANYGGESGTGTGSPSNSSIPPCQYHPTVVLHTHILPG
jgi:peptide methionine sulfoxide reductase MsrA